MISGEFGPISSDTLFTQTARNMTIDIQLSDLTYVKGTRAVQSIVHFIQGYCKYIWLEITFVLFLNRLF